jgi:hypothetical protein
MRSRNDIVVVSEGVGGIVVVVTGIVVDVVGPVGEGAVVEIAVPRPVAAIDVDESDRVARPHA